MVFEFVGGGTIAERYCFLFCIMIGVKKGDFFVICLIEIVATEWERERKKGVNLQIETKGKQDGEPKNNKKNIWKKRPQMPNIIARYHIMKCYWNMLDKVNDLQLLFELYFIFVSHPLPRSGHYFSIFFLYATDGWIIKDIVRIGMSFISASLKLFPFNRWCQYICLSRKK